MTFTKNLTARLMTLLLTATIVSFAPAQGSIEGTYSTYLTVSGKTKVVSLSLASKGAAGLTQMIAGSQPMPQLTGVWRKSPDGLITVILSEGRNKQSFVFRQMANGTLVTTEWDKNVWGRTALTFAKSTPSGGGGAMMPNVVGTYYLMQGDGKFQRLWTLSLTASRKATLVSQSNRDSNAARFEGNWQQMANGAVRFDVSEGRTHHVMNLRTADNPMRLVAMNWKQSDWGRTAPEFRRGTPPTLPPPPNTDIQGTYRMQSKGANGPVSYTLTLKDRAAATLFVDFQGTGKKDMNLSGDWGTRGGNTISVGLRGPMNVSFTFRRQGNALMAIAWDQTQFGSTPPNFFRVK